VGFIKSDKVLAVFYVFICIWGKKKVCTCPVNQLPIVRPLSLKLKSHILGTNTQFTSRSINLCFRWRHCEQPRLLDCQRPTLVVSV